MVSPDVSQLPDWAELVAGAVERFGSGVRVTHLRLDSVPGYELGESVESRGRRAGLWLETYEHNMPGFGPLLEEAPQLPKGWKRRGEVAQ